MVEAAGVEPSAHYECWALTTAWEKNGKNEGEMFSEKQLYKALELYRQDVPFKGTITKGKADKLLEKGEVCRGWIIDSGGLEYFHIIKSPNDYPELTMLVSEDKEQLFMMTIMMGMQNNIDLDDLFTK